MEIKKVFEDLYFFLTKKPANKECVVQKEDDWPQGFMPRMIPVEEMPWTKKQIKAALKKGITHQQTIYACGEIRYINVYA